jgi:hypothetical protein
MNYKLNFILSAKLNDLFEFFDFPITFSKKMATFADLKRRTK